MLHDTELRSAGITQYGTISPADITFSKDIRAICEKNVCRLYGTTWACPPAVGTVAQCRERCLEYRNTLVFTGSYPLADSFDYEGMVAGHGEFKKLCDRLSRLAKDEYGAFLLLSNEGCNRCSRCTYPASACRTPDMLFPSLEGYGIDVSALAVAAGLDYHCGTNTVTYFGMLLSL